MHLRHFFGLTTLVVFTLNLAAADSGATLRRFTGLPGGDGLSKISSASSYPYSPAAILALSAAEGQRLLPGTDGAMLESVWTVPVTGAWKLALASDDSSQLFISLAGDGLPINLKQVATLNGWTSFRNYTVQASAQSASLNLVAGQKIFLRALVKDGGGADHISIGAYYFRLSKRLPIWETLIGLPNVQGENP